MSLSRACCAALALVLFSSCGKEQVVLEQRTGEATAQAPMAAASGSPGAESPKPGSPAAGEPVTGPAPSGDEDAEDTSEGLPPGVGVRMIEIVCRRTKAPHYRTSGNPRFGFCIDLPVQWTDGEMSGNGDGWSVLLGDPSVDLRVYGSNRPIGIDLRREDRERYQELKGPRGAVADFVFADGVVGACIRNGQEIKYMRPEATYWATLYVKADEAWLRRNEGYLLTIARSLRSGEQREGPAIFPKSQGRPKDEVL